MKLAEMLKKAEIKLKEIDKNLIVSPWQTTAKYAESGNNVETNIGTKHAESGNNVETNVGTKYAESGNNVETNVGTKYAESGNNVETNVGTKYAESGNNVETNVGTKYAESGNNVETNVGTKYAESGNNVETNFDRIMRHKIKKLSGIQLQLMHYINTNKFKNNNYYLIHINIKEISIESSPSLDVIRTSIRRLSDKNIIIRQLGVMGRNGFSVFKIPPKTINFFQKEHCEQKTNSSIYNSNNITTTIINKNSADQNSTTVTGTQKIIENLTKQLEAQKQQIANLSSQLHLQPQTSSKEDLTAYLNKQLSNTDNNILPDNTNLPTDQSAWDAIDISALEPFGFKPSHIRQIIKFQTELTPKEVQDSIDHYAWALNNNLEAMEKRYDHKFKNNKLCILMGTFRKGNVWVEAGYRSNEEIALESQLQAQKTRLAEQQAKKEELFTVEFELWYNDLPPEKIKMIETNREFKQISAASFYKKMESAQYKAAMRNHYRQLK